MKTMQSARMAGLVIGMSIFFSSCFKDTVTRTYTMYVPEYKTSAEVRANIKPSEPITIENAGKLLVLGNYIFLNEINKGIHIIDNHNPAAPVNKYFIHIPGNLDLAAKGNTLYADLYTDLVTIDISDPANAKVKKITDNVFPYRRYQDFIQDTTKVITNWIKKDTTITDSYQPMHWMSNEYMTVQSLGNSSASPTIGVNGSMSRFTVVNNYLYSVTNAGLNVFDITQSENPLFQKLVNLGWGIETIYPFKNNLFIGSQTGMLIYSVSDPINPVQVGNFSHSRVCDPVIADDKFAYITLRTGSACFGTANELDIVNIEKLPTTSFIRSYPLSNPHGLSKDGNLLFVCDATEGLKVFDCSDVTKLTLIKTMPGMNAFDVIAINDVALVSAKDGLYEYDYSNINNIRLLSKISFQ